MILALLNLGRFFSLCVLCFCLILVLVPFSFAKKEQGEEPVCSVKITHSIYSGLPSPEWTETDLSQIKKMTERLINLPQVDSNGEPHLSGLGGFILWFKGDAEPCDAFYYVRVNKGYIEIQNKKRESQIARDSKQLEVYLGKEMKRLKVIERHSF